jgi:hypothetical protein
MTIEEFLLVSQIHVVLAGVIALMSLVRFRQKTMESKAFGLAGLLVIVTMLSVSVITLKGKQVNIPQNLNTPFHFVIILFVYYRILGRRFTFLLLTTGISFFVFYVFNFFFWQGYDNLNTYSLAVRAMFIVTYCIVYWYQLLAELPVQQLHRLPMFWYNASLLLYNAATLFLFLFYSYFVDVLHNDMLIYWTFHNILSAIQFFVFAIGQWQDLRNIKLRSSSPSVP